MKKLAMILFVSFMAVSAGAANWVEAGSNPEKGIYNYIDTESISTQGKYKQSFSKSTNIPDEHSIVMLTSYDCKSNPKRMKITHITLYDLEGNFISRTDDTLTTSFQPVLPETIFKTQTNIICNF